MDLKRATLISLRLARPLDRCLSARYQQHWSVITRDCHPSSGFSGLFDGAREFQPLLGKRFVVSLTFIAPAVRERLALCRASAELFSHITEMARHADLP
jgi:hypothetical protein